VDKKHHREIPGSVRIPRASDNVMDWRRMVVSELKAMSRKYASDMMLKKRSNVCNEEDKIETSDDDKEDRKPKARKLR